MLSTDNISGLYLKTELVRGKKIVGTRLVVIPKKNKGTKLLLACVTDLMCDEMIRKYNNVIITTEKGNYK